MISPNNDVLLAVSMVKSERKQWTQAKRLTRSHSRSHLLVLPLFMVACIYLLSISSAHATYHTSGIKGSFDDQHENNAPVVKVDKELTAEQKAFDDFIEKINSGTLQLDTQEDFDQKVVELANLLPEGDEERRLTLVYYDCALKSIFDPGKGVEIANDMISDAIARGKRTEEGVLNLCIANYFQRVGKVSEAMLKIEKTIDIAEEVNDNYLLADGYISRCGLRSFLGENDFALQDCIKAEQLYLEEDVIDSSHGLIFDIGIIYRRLGFLDKAEKYFDRSQKYFEEENMQFGNIRVNLQKGFLQEQRGNYEQAIKLYQAALEIAEKYKLNTDMVPIRIALAGGYNGNGQYGKALQELRLAEDARQQIGHGGYDGMATMNYGIALSNLEQPEQAEQFFIEAEQQMLRDNNKRYLALLYGYWSESYKRAGNSELALEKLEKQIKLQTELDRQRSDQQTQVLRFEYDSERTELENEQLLKEQKLKDEQLASMEKARRWQTLAIVLGSLLTLLMIWFSIRQIAHSRRFKQLAYTDSLTGLANRRQIERALGKAMETASQTGKSLSILMYDIDHFKVVNDIHGHSVGDVVLTNLSNFSKELLRDNDLLGRTGGEEFLAVLPNANLDQAIQVAKRLQQEVDLKQYTEIESDLNATISVGVTEYKHGENMDEFLRRVDEALYQAKENGRNRVEYVI